MGEALEQIEGVRGGAPKGLFVEDLLGEGADQGLAAEFDAEGQARLEDDLVNMQRAAGGQEYILDKIHIRLTFLFILICEWGGFFPERSQRFELSVSRRFQNFQQFNAREWRIWHKDSEYF
jgi:hypothetical protein